MRKKESTESVVVLQMAQAVLVGLRRAVGVELVEHPEPQPIRSPRPGQAVLDGQGQLGVAVGSQGDEYTGRSRAGHSGRLATGAGAGPRLGP